MHQFSCAGRGLTCDLRHTNIGGTPADGACGCVSWLVCVMGYTNGGGGVIGKGTRASRGVTALNHMHMICHNDPGVQFNLCYVPYLLLKHNSFVTKFLLHQIQQKKWSREKSTQEGIHILDKDKSLRGLQHGFLS